MVIFHSVASSPCSSFCDAALRDHRIELVRASWQELTIRISDVGLSDEGQYTCSLFTMPVKTTKAFLTVLGECDPPSADEFFMFWIRLWEKKSYNLVRTRYKMLI